MAAPVLDDDDARNGAVDAQTVHLHMARVVVDIAEHYPDATSFLMAVGLGLAVGWEHRTGTRTCSVEEDLDVLFDQVRESIRMMYNPS